MTLEQTATEATQTDLQAAITVLKNCHCLEANTGDNRHDGFETLIQDYKAAQKRTTLHYARRLVRLLKGGTKAAEAEL